ncbi:hypothetical protein NL676_031543 [Syzygium grande]|nr:hypothetical protein NL676_031543 [Syzygium grande]
MLIDQQSKKIASICQGKDRLEAYSTLKQHTFSLACRLFMSITDPQIISRLANHFHVFLSGVVGLPPRRPWHKLLLVKESSRFHQEGALGVGEAVPDKAGEEDGSPSQDILSHLIANGDENGKLMPEAEIINNMLNLLFVGHDTFTLTLVLIIKYLSELSHILEKVIAG